MGRRGKRHRNGQPKGTNDSSHQKQKVEVTWEVGDGENSRNSASDSLLPNIAPFDPATFSEDSLPENLKLKDVQRLWQLFERIRGRKLTPNPIQLQTWPLLLSEHKRPTNLKCLAPTASGKTIAYGLPMVIKALSLRSNGVYGLILVPTRELALQVDRELRVLTRKEETLHILALYGGVDKEMQLQQLWEHSRKTLLVTATPGRLLDLLSLQQSAGEAPETSVLSLFRNLQALILDEADRLASNRDMARQVDHVLETLPSTEDRFVCLFSATYPHDVQDRWDLWAPASHRCPRICVKLNTVTIGDGRNDDSRDPGDSKETTLSGHPEPTTKRHKRSALETAQIPAHLTQILHVCAAHKKPKKLLAALNKIRNNKDRENNNQTRHHKLCLVFFAKIKTIQYMRKLLANEGLACTELHSQLSQPQRERALLNFKSGKTPIMLATDIAARGIHCNHIDVVIQYDFPSTLDQYVHRCGRAGRKQAAITASDKCGTNPTMPSATVYSFFTRNMAPMAPGVVALLRASSAWIDPNLLELAKSVDDAEANDSNNSENKQQAQSKRGNKTKDSGSEEELSKPGMERDDSDGDDGQFASLNPKRIMLQRASHVSDPSDFSDEEDDSDI